MSFARQENVPYPTVWEKFSGKIETEGIKRKYWIQDLTEEYYDEVLKYMSSGFIRKSPICVYTSFSKDEESIKDYVKVWRNMFDLKLSVICLTNDANNCTKLVGCNILGRRYKGEKKNIKEIYKGKASSISGTALNHVYCNLIDVFSELKIEEYLSAFGLYVLPEYRGDGIGYQLLKVREKVCLAVGMRVSVTAFTTISGQRLAEKLGFIELLEIAYRDLEKMDENFKFPGINEGETKTLKLMYKIYQ